MISLQRRSGSEWWLLVESERSPLLSSTILNNRVNKFQLDVVRLLVSHTAAAVRAGQADGAEATVRVLPYRSVSLDAPPFGTKCQPDWYSFDQHRWDVIGCTKMKPRANLGFGKLGAAVQYEMEVSLLDLEGEALEGGGRGEACWKGPVAFPERQGGIV